MEGPSYRRRHIERLNHRSNDAIQARADDDCEPADPANTVTDRLNSLLQNGGEGYVLRLCPKQTYLIQAPILFAHPGQEISTLGYPTDDDRATLAVNGPVADGQGHTTAIDGTCANCSRIKIRNIQINGTRGGAPSTNGGGNIEIGGDNADQLVEFVRSYDPRGWTCLHVAEGPLTCTTVTIQNNDIGPCGTDTFQQWADGISLSCRNSIVRNNMIQDATDGGIVVFGSAGSHIYNNTIWVVNSTLLGGINLVDYDPWGGDYTGTEVLNNVIMGGFATDVQDNTKGVNADNSIIKIGIAIGPRTWFGDRFGDNKVRNGIVRGNQLSGAFSYGIAATSAIGFTVQENQLVGNTAFIGARGPLCEETDVVPDPAPFIMDPDTIQGSYFQSDFKSIGSGDSLTCVLPPNGGDFWPYGTTTNTSSSPTSPSKPVSAADTGNSSGRSAGIAIGVIAGIIICGVATWYIRKAILARREASQLYKSSKEATYTQKI
ncbi:hypothetical protein CPC08DRAFT_736100 [Agrocybe pediades]|nr:hypothetical protein CPC08DRAFT_736100 [Agrocybe pediades]